MSVMDRTKNILVRPKQQWQTIDAEPATVGGLYAGYVVPLAAIGPIASLIGMSLIGVSGFGISYRVPIGAGLKLAVTQYVLALVGVFVLALIVDALAPAFGGQKNRLQALKVVAYSSTAAWVVGIAGLIPTLGILGLLGLYSLYLLYLGLPTAMKAPPEKSMGYTIVVIICAVVLFFVIGAIAGQLAWRPAIPGM